MPCRVIRISLEIEPPGPGIRSLTGPPFPENLADIAVTVEIAMIDIALEPDLLTRQLASCLRFNEETVAGNLFDRNKAVDLIIAARNPQGCGKPEPVSTPESFPASVRQHGILQGPPQGDMQEVPGPARFTSHDRLPTRVALLISPCVDHLSWREVSGRARKSRG